MGIRKTVLFYTQLGLAHEGSLDGFLYRKMTLFISSCWFCICNYLVFLIRFIARHVFRIKLDYSPQKNEFTVLSMKESKRLEPIPEAIEFKEMDYDEFREKEASSFSFKFQYPIPEGCRSNNEEPAISNTKGETLSTNTSIHNYRFLSEKDFSGFVKEPEPMTFCIQESYVDSSGDCRDEGKTDTEFKGFLLAKEFLQPSLEPVTEEVHRNSEAEVFTALKKAEHVILSKNQAMEKEISMNSENNVLGENNDFCGFDSDSESVCFSDGYSIKKLIIDSAMDGFLSERDFEEFEAESDTTATSMDFSNAILCNEFVLEGGSFEPESKTEEKFHGEEIVPKKDHHQPELESKEQNGEKTESSEVAKFSETQLPISSALPRESIDSSYNGFSSLEIESNNLESSVEVLSLRDLANPKEKLEGLDGEERGEIAEIQVPNLNNSDNQFKASTGDLLNLTDESKQVDATLLGRDADTQVRTPEVLGCKKKEPEEDLQKSKETRLNGLNTEDTDELESLWEHQDLIEQLRMELRKVRAIGLPTILEESESPKTMEDLKPWKIDEKFLHENPMDELHKFYKSYRERMRKFDILNYQKMYAIGFLQLKDPLQSMGSQKSLIPTITSRLSQSFWPFRHQKLNADPSEKFIKELQIDLETVYVGQACLSWEFLRWQYEKARRLPDSDPYRSHQYNHVAGEFQQFQVLVQRFLEDESFQGPRVPNYVRNRCVLRHLLQVPIIKEDCLKDKMEERRKGNDAITSEMLEDIMEEAIRIFWEFVKGDKDETPVLLKGLRGTQVELQDSSDFELMVDIQTILLKKEKKLKDLWRTGNCIVKKFKRPQEDRSNQDLFFSQVDLKLVSRVLKMSRITTDQLVWCHKKLSKITFAERKLHREPSFLLFPC